MLLLLLLSSAVTALVRWWYLLSQHGRRCAAVQAVEHLSWLPEQH